MPVYIGYVYYTVGVLCTVLTLLHSCIERYVHGMPCQRDQCYARATILRPHRFCMLHEKYNSNSRVHSTAQLAAAEGRLYPAMSKDNWPVGITSTHLP